MPVSTKICNLFPVNHHSKNGSRDFPLKYWPVQQLLLLLQVLPLLLIICSFGPVNRIRISFKIILLLSLNLDVDGSTFIGSVLNSFRKFVCCLNFEEVGSTSIGVCYGLLLLVFTSVLFYLGFSCPLAWLLFCNSSFLFANIVANLYLSWFISTSRAKAKALKGHKDDSTKK